jgi:hypothetical protein
VASYIYTLLVIGFLQLLASLPSIVLLFFLAPDVSNFPLAALCVIPVGPALSASVYSLHHRRSDLTELRPTRQYFHAYRLNVRAVLPVWVLGLAWLTIIAVTLANLSFIGFPGWWAVLLLLIGMLAAVWTANALIITSLFEFRVRDVMRLAWFMIPRVPMAALGNAGVIIGAVLFGYFTSDLLLIVVAVIFVNFLVVTSRPMTELVTAEYTRK